MFNRRMELQKEFWCVVCGIQAVFYIQTKGPSISLFLIVTKYLCGREARAHVTSDVTEAHRLRKSRLSLPWSGSLFCRPLPSFSPFCLLTFSLCFHFRRAPEICFRSRQAGSEGWSPQYHAFLMEHTERQVCPVGGQTHICFLMLPTSLCVGCGCLLIRVVVSRATIFRGSPFLST